MTNDLCIRCRNEKRKDNPVPIRLAARANDASITEEERTRLMGLGWWYVFDRRHGATIQLFFCPDHLERKAMIDVHQNQIEMALRREEQLHDDAERRTP